MSESDKIVLASTYAQFLLWLDELKDQKTRLQYHYVSNTQDLLEWSSSTSVVILEPILEEVKFIRVQEMRKVARARFVNVTYERT